MLFHRYLTSRQFALSNPLVCVTLSNAQFCLVIVTTLLKKEGKIAAEIYNKVLEFWLGGRLKESKAPFILDFPDPNKWSHTTPWRRGTEEETAAERWAGLNRFEKQAAKLARKRNHWCWLPALLCLQLIAALQCQKHEKEALTAFPFSSQVTVGTGRPVAVHRNVTTDPKVMFWDSGAFRILANTAREDKVACWMIK